MVICYPAESSRKSPPKQSLQLLTKLKQFPTCVLWGGLHQQIIEGISSLATAEPDEPKGGPSAKKPLENHGIFGEYRAMSKITVRDEADQQVRR